MSAQGLNGHAVKLHAMNLIPSSIHGTSSDALRVTLLHQLNNTLERSVCSGSLNALARAHGINVW